jgi:hypothetical protein
LLRSPEQPATCSVILIGGLDSLSLERRPAELRSPSFFDGDLVAVKLRALNPISKNDKWKKWKRDEGVCWLYNREAAEAAMFGDNLFIVESELDSLTAETAGFFAVSVDSAKHKLNEPDLILLRRTMATRIFAPDNDEPGLQGAISIAKDLEIIDAASVKFPGKDLGELYTADPPAFSEALDKLTSNTLPLWRRKFHVGSELNPNPPAQAIEHILIEGINFIGSLSGIGKTWLALSMSRAIVSGEPFLGQAAWRVPERRNVLYLCPEMGDKGFRKRMEKMKIPMEEGEFSCYVRTMNDGALALNDPVLAYTVRETNPVVILDTAIRFNTSENENDSSETAGRMSNLLFDLIRAGATTIVCLHHSPKAASEANFMKLENVLRGSGEFGAMAEVVWGIQHARKSKGGGNKWDEGYAAESGKLTRLFVQCVKPRDLEAADPFVVQGRPYIDETGDFALLAMDAEHGEDVALAATSGVGKAIAIIQTNAAVTKSELSRQTGIDRRNLEKELAQEGWYWKPTSGREGIWESKPKEDSDDGSLEM